VVSFRGHVTPYHFVSLSTRFNYSFPYDICEYSGVKVGDWNFDRASQLFLYNRVEIDIEGGCSIDQWIEINWI